MNHYEESLVGALSNEALTKSAGEGIVANDGSDMADFKITLIGDGIDEKEIDTLIKTIKRERIDGNYNVSIEGHSHDPDNAELLGNTSNGRDNLVVNGVYLPDYVADQNADVPVRVIDRTTRLSSLNKDEIIYVIDDFDADKIAKTLVDEGFVAVTSPLELSKAIIERKHTDRYQ